MNTSMGPRGRVPSHIPNAVHCGHGQGGWEALPQPALEKLHYHMSRTQVRVITAQPGIGEGNSNVSDLGEEESGVSESMALSSPYAHPLSQPQSFSQVVPSPRTPSPPNSFGQVQLWIPPNRISLKRVL